MPRAVRDLQIVFVLRAAMNPYGAYALQRSRLFALASRRQLLWIQAEDYLEDAHFADKSMAEKYR